MTWSELPGKLKLYIGFLACLAIPIFIWSVWQLANTPPNIIWLVLVVLAILTVPFHVLLESANATISIGDAYIMAIGMMYGPAPCIVATFCHTFLVSLLAKRKIPLYRIVFNAASTICVAWLYSSLYHQIDRNSLEMTVIIPCSLIVSITYFVANSSLVSIAISWSIKERFFRFWVKNCLPLAQELSLSTAVATIIVLLQAKYKYVSLYVSPIFGLLWAYHALNKSRIISNQARLAEAEKHLKEQEELYLRTVESLALAVDAKDQTTYGHIRRVKVFSIGLAKLCGIKDSNEFRAIETGSLLHDIGKLAIDDYILNKPGKLTKQEFEKIKMHAAAGDEILQQVRFPFPVAKYVRYHHERWDGTGYPDGLKGEEIPLGARILCVADAFDAIRYSRPYKLSMSNKEALDTLCAQSGTFFDPNIVRLLVDHIDELAQTALSESENAPELSFRKYFEAVDPTASTPSRGPVTPEDIPAELVHLAEFCSTLSGYFDLNDILPIVLRQMERIVPFDTSVLYIANNGVQLKAICSVGKFSEILQGHSMEMGMGISGWVAAYQRPMINTGPALDFKGIQHDFTCLTDALVVPIIHKDESLGTLSFYAQKSAFYSQNHMNILQTLASLLAPLISESKKRALSEPLEILDPTTQIHRISYLTTIGPQLISMAGGSRSPLSLIYLDIRNWNQIIQIYGTDQGNSLLRRIADCIKPELRETDTLVRYGNQGFVAFLPGVRNEQALRCAQRLKQQIKREVLTTGQGLTIDCKTGIATYPKDGSTVMALLQSAQGSMEPPAQDTVAPDRNVIDFFPRT
jgi:diguanylate cyclase (GGDEF)-like protein